MELELEESGMRLVDLISWLQRNLIPYTSEFNAETGQFKIRATVPEKISPENSGGEKWVVGSE